MASPPASRSSVRRRVGHDGRQACGRRIQKLLRRSPQEFEQPSRRRRRHARRTAPPDEPTPIFTASPRIAPRRPRPRSSPSRIRDGARASIWRDPHRTARVPLERALNIKRGSRCAACPSPRARAARARRDAGGGLFRADHDGRPCAGSSRDVVEYDEERADRPVRGRPRSSCAAARSRRAAARACSRRGSHPHGDGGGEEATNDLWVLSGTPVPDARRRSCSRAAAGRRSAGRACGSSRARARCAHRAVRGAGGARTTRSTSSTRGRRASRPTRCATPAAPASSSTAGRRAATRGTPSRGTPRARSAVRRRGDRGDA